MNQNQNGLIDPGKSFTDLVNAMPERFFELYNELAARGCSHRTADRAAREMYDFEVRLTNKDNEGQGD